MLEELDPLLDPSVFVVGRIPFDRDVVRQVPALERPNLKEVGLKLGDEVDRGAKLVPVLGLLKILGFFPKVVGGDPAHSGELEDLEEEVARVDLTDLRLAQVVFLAQALEYEGVGNHRHEEEQDAHGINNLPIAIELRPVRDGRRRCDRAHEATSRCFRMK